MECLAQQAALSRETAAWLLSFGAVYVDRLRADADRALLPGQYVRVHFDPKRFPVRGIDWSTTLVHRDEKFVVVNKPAEIPVHATVDNWAENVLYQLGAACGEHFYITQRLDVRVSGLIVFARTQEFQRQFNGLLVERRVKKRYLALVTAAPVLGRHVHFMEPTERSPKIVKAEAFPNSLECALSVRALREIQSPGDSPQIFEVEIDLETGRTHQIRAQLSAMGSPILGDVHYGSPTPFEVKRNSYPGIALFSTSISWIDRDGQLCSFTRTPPWSEDSTRD